VTLPKRLQIRHLQRINREENRQLNGDSVKKPHCSQGANNGAGTEKRPNRTTITVTDLENGVKINFAKNTIIPKLHSGNCLLQILKKTHEPKTCVTV
jgi:hypothetical protein